MPVYTGVRQSMLDAVLGEYLNKGFRLMERDDHVTQLYYKNKLIVVFIQQHLSITTVHQMCRMYLEKKGEA